MNKRLAALPLFITLALVAFTYPYPGGVFPTPPVPFQPLDFSVVYYDNKTGTQLFDPSDAQHGPECQGPDILHHITEVRDRTFICANHVMTAVNSVGTGAVYLTPNRMVDFSGGTAIVRWDMSTARASSRDWIDIVIAPWDDEQQVNLQDASRPINAIVATMDPNVGAFPGQSKLLASVYRNFVRSGLGTTGTGGWESFGFDNDFIQASIHRQTFQIEISRDHIRVGMPTYNRWWVDAPISPPLTWDQGVVQFNHRAYNPGKDESSWCANTPTGRCGPTTWHWSGFTVDPSVPFTMIHGQQEYARVGASTITFPSPAPVGAVLRFSALSSTASGRALQMSSDGGLSYQTMTRQPQVPAGTYLGDEWYKSYRMAIPAGVSEIRLRAADGSSGWIARNFELFAMGSQPVPTASPAGTVVIPPTSTATPTLEPTPTEISTATATPTPEATATGTALPTSEPTAIPVGPSPSPVGVEPTGTPEPTMTPTVQPANTAIPLTGTPTPVALRCEAALFRGDELIHGAEVPCP